jgi:tRNA-dihydrouridine synthase B
MIGRAAQGRPWIFREIAHYLAAGERLAPPLVAEIRSVLLEHLDELYEFYGRDTGVRVARKHIAWYTKGLAGAAAFRTVMNKLETCEEQVAAVDRFLGRMAEAAPRLVYEEEDAA